MAGGVRTHREFDLLQEVKAACGVEVAIEPNHDVVSDRSLNGGRFREATGFVAPTWPEMLAELAADPTPYEQWRREP